MLLIVEKILTGVLVFGFLIFFHELGHFLLAKWSKIKVYEFAFGLPFGKKIARLWHDGETEYTIRPCPLGGFVAFADVDADEETREKQMEAYHRTPILGRFATILAGPLFSLALGWAGFVLLAGIYGVPDGGAPVVQQAVVGKPAYAAGLRAGDTLLQVDGRAMRQDELITYINLQPGKPISFLIKGKDGTERTVSVTPAAEKDGKRTVGRIGVAFGATLRRVSGWGEALSEGSRQTRLYYESLGRVLSNFQRVKENVGGPVGIAGQVSQATEAGWGAKLGLLASLSLSLAAFNMFPIPALDGGQLLLLLAEAIRKRQLSKENQMRLMAASWCFLLLFFVVVTFNDITKLFVR